MVEQGYSSQALWVVLGVFWNRGERRLRALWRLVLSLVLFGVLTVALGIGFQLFAIRSLLVGILSGAVPESAVSAVLRVVGLLRRSAHRGRLGDKRCDGRRVGRNLLPLKFPDRVHRRPLTAPHARRA